MPLGGLLRATPFSLMAPGCSPMVVRLALAVFTLPVACLARPVDWWGQSLRSPGPSAPFSWFNQTLDHYSPTNTRNFRQRFFEVTKYASGADAPVLLYICGEAPCGGVPDNFVLALAKHWGAVAVALEHRYYGESMPFPDTSTEHLAYLSTKQALADLANFRGFYQSLLCSRVGVRRGVPEADSLPGSCGGNKWVVVGGSYAGAMSAWLRLKFPHLFHASLASSAVVNVILDFYQFDEQVLESAGPECGSALQQVTAEVLDVLRYDREGALSLFEADAMKDDRDFLFLVADAAVFAFQYGRPDSVCTPLLDARARGGSLLLAFANYTREVFFKYFGGRPSDYDQDALKDTSLGPRSGMRVWWFQCCTEMAYFQTAPPKQSVRAIGINMQYWRDFCSNVFGEGIFPNTRATNMFYGSTGIKGSRIFFSNGSQDPWKRASKLHSSLGEPSILVPCHNCGHCVDMRGCPPQNVSSALSSHLGTADDCTDPAAVRRARRIIRDTLTAWLQEPADTVAIGSASL